ncbi:hypothetical protein HF086_012342 [Spodoptera exigua]|uniref:Uncharacterized protein n=1 Tax=Spodoptera exigua TaxID=7107 RepID=A0A922MA12_SPOEX|nr:hypothetical protein HF086_012342 [Spodoptera exigua]
MSSYDALLDSQSDNLNAIKRINENFKKDSPTRKTTLEYHDERLQKLEEYWSDFKNNDIQLALFEGKKSGPYYENRVYERLEQIYEETKSMINKSKQRLLAKIEDDKFTSFTQLQQQEERSSAQEVVKEQREREEVTYDVKNTTSNEELVVDQRTKDMLNEQRSNIKAFERTIRNMDIENLKEKWQLEDKLSWDPLVVHILMQKLDADTCQSFKESMEKPKEMPSLNELLKFIETKFMSMESGANPNRPRNSNSQQQNTQPKTVHNATYSKPKAQQQTSPGGAKNMPRTYHNKQTSHHSFITCPKLPNSPIEVPDTTTSNDKSCSEPQKAVTNNTKQRFKSSKISSSLLCILVTLLTLFQPTRQSSDGINVTPFEPNRGVYFDKIGNLQTVHDDWKIVTYYNMTTYWQGMENIHRVVKHLGERCEQFAYQTLCKTIMTEFEQELNELDHNNYMLETHHGQTRGALPEASSME